MSLRIIITGGTFDKLYDPIAGQLTFKHTHLPAIMERVRVTVPYTLEISQLIDSLEMQEQGRQSILRSCETAAEPAIVITHGTDTMIRTAEVLARAKLPKTIVLTGAMIPYSIEGSDALFNLGSAITAAQLLPHGVWVAMNGRTFAWDAVQKDKNQGIFVPIDPAG